MPRVKLEDHKNAKKKIKELKTDLKTMHKDDKDYANKEFDLADLYLSDEQYTDASIHFKIAENMYEDRREFLQQAEALSKLYKCYYDQGRYKEAQHYLKRKLKLVLDHFTLQSSLELGQQQTYLNLGTCYYMRAKQADTIETQRAMLDKAEESLKKSLKIVKDAGEQWKDKIAENHIWECLARVHKKRKDYKRAIECLKTAVPKMDCFHEENLKDYITIAHCYAKLGQLKKATVYLEKTLKFMNDTPSSIHADLGDYYFKLKEFDNSLLHYRKNLRIFKQQTRFDNVKFGNAVENVRSAKRAKKISQIRKTIGEKLAVAVKKGDKNAQMRLLEKSGDFAFDQADELEAISMYKQILPLCEGDTKKTLMINDSIGNAYDKLAERESNKEYAKKAMEYYNRNYEICNEQQDNSGMADALVHKATTLELEFLNTHKSDIVKEYKRASVLALRSKTYSLLVTIYENLATLFSNWKGQERARVFVNNILIYLITNIHQEAEEYEKKAAKAREQKEEQEENEEENEDELELVDEDEEDIEENDEDDEDLRDVEEYMARNTEPKVNPVEIKTKLGPVIERVKERQKKRTGLVPLQEGEYDKEGNLLPAYRDDFIVDDDDDTEMDQKDTVIIDDEPREKKTTTTQTKETKEIKKETKETKETVPPKSKIEEFILKSRNGRKHTANKIKIEDLDNEDEGLTPYQAQRKRQRELEEFGELEKETKKKASDKKEKSEKRAKTQHTPQEQLVETKLFGRRVLQNKETGKILRSFKDDWIVQDGKEYDSDDLNADLDSDEEQHNSKYANLPSYTKDFIVDG